MTEVPQSAVLTGQISLSLALWIIELAPGEKILFSDILSVPATECQANVQNPHGPVPLPGSCHSNWSKFLHFLIMTLLQHKPEESLASPGRRIPCFALPDACQCNKLRVFQFGCNFLRLVIFPGYAKNNFMQICLFTVVIFCIRGLGSLAVGSAVAPKMIPLFRHFFGCRNDCAMLQHCCGVFASSCSTRQL